nr:MAG TPA: hypothetical protein [Caudoviricetes sp.]
MIFNNEFDRISCVRIKVEFLLIQGMEYDKKNFDNKIFRFIYTEAMKGTAISLSYKGEKTDL